MVSTCFAILIQFVQNDTIAFKLNYRWGIKGSSFPLSRKLSKNVISLPGIHET